MNARASLILAFFALSAFAVAPAVSAEPDSKTAEPKWRSLFDGKMLGDWKASGYAGQPEPKIEQGKLVLPFGEPMSGVTYTGEMPKTNYELSFDAMRVDGNDFFCGLTFPVGEEPCTLILGGWGGGVVGLSSIDGNDASTNSTASHRKFESGKWYKVRLQVSPERIDAWLDDEKIVSFEKQDHKLSIRIEVAKSKPLGVSTYATTGALRDIKIRELPAAETAKQ